MTIWMRSSRFDPAAKALADRHYNRQKPDSPQFVPPGHCVVLLSKCQKAVWVTSWQQYADHEWAGAWTNTLFRNEGAGLSSQLIEEALSLTADEWEFPPEGCVTFVDEDYVKPTMVRGRKIYGFCYMKAGFEHIGYTNKRGLWVWQRKAPPRPSPPIAGLRRI